MPREPGSTSGSPAGTTGWSDRGSTGPRRHALRRLWLGAAGRDPWHEGSAARSLRASLSLIAAITLTALLTALAGLVLVLDVVLPSVGPGAGQSSNEVTAVRVLLLVDVLACAVVMSLVVRERARLAVLGDHLALERARAEETHHGVVLQAEHMRVVLGVAERLSGQVSVADVAAVVTRAAREITGAPDAILWVSDPSQGLTRVGARTSRPVAAPSLKEAPGTAGPVRRGNGWAVPLVASGETVGVLEMPGIAAPPRPVETVVEALAAHAAGAVEATNRYAMLRKASFTDPLTGLPNRGALDLTLGTECDRAARTGGDLAVVMVDVDHFKAYNDRYGHPDGDMALAGVARVLQTGLRRKGDTAYRYGGEEFLLVLPGADAASGLAVAERLKQAVAEAADSGRMAYPVTASFGVAARTERRTSAAQLIAAADDALYRAKHRGRDRVEVAPDDERPDAGVRPA